MKSPAPPKIVHIIPSTRDDQYSYSYFIDCSDDAYVYIFNAPNCMTDYNNITEVHTHIPTYPAQEISVEILF